MAGLHLTAQQAGVYMSQRNKEASQVVAAARSGMSLRTATRLEKVPATFLARTLDLQHGNRFID
jgi:hypothetical protein